VELITLILDVEQQELEMVKTMTEEALGEPPMLLDGDRLVFMQPFPYEMRPGKSESQKGQQFGDALVVLEMARFKVKAAGLQGCKKRFDLPSLGVQGQSMVGFGVGSDNQVVPLQLYPYQREPVAIDPAALGKEVCLTDAQVLEVLAGVTGSTLGADERVVLDADVKGQTGGSSPNQPVPINSRSATTARTFFASTSLRNRCKSALLSSRLELPALAKRLQTIGKAMPL
jgi:hypothetical protein